MAQSQPSKWQAMNGCAASVCQVSWLRLCPLAEKLLIKNSPCTMFTAFRTGSVDMMLNYSPGKF